MITIEHILKVMTMTSERGGKIHTPIISPKANDMLKRIREIEPSFRFSFELEIWLKASELGLVSEEKDEQ